MTAPAIVKNPAATRMLKFYEIGEALEIAREWLLEPDHQQALIDADGDLDALPELKDLLEGVELDFAIKAEHVAIMAREFALTAGALKEEVVRLMRLERSAIASEKGLKAYLRTWFIRLNIKKVEGTRAKPRIQVNNPAIRSTYSADELSQLHALESPFVKRVVPAPVFDVDRDAVLAAYSAAAQTVGPMPELGTPGYHEKRAAWDAAMDAALHAAGVPAGISVDRGFHTRIG